MMRLDISIFQIDDHLGNTRVAYIPTPTSNPYIINAVDYYPYGKVLREYDNGAGDRYLSTQHERDRETGLDYRGARYYDSDVARFLSLDPLAAKYPMLSAYNYVGGNPVMLIDPDGREIRNSKGEDISTKKHEKQTRWTENHVHLNEVFGDANGFTSAIIPKLGDIKSVTQDQHNKWQSQGRSNSYIISASTVTSANIKGDVFVDKNRRKPVGNRGNLWEFGCPMLYKVQGSDQLYALTPILMQRENTQEVSSFVELPFNHTDAQFGELLKRISSQKLIG
ncbi:hypothetical protein D3C71_644250 [compost metagenome]